jgi:hypothetical protein
MKLLSLFWAMCAWAQSGIDVPSMGAIIDSSGALRPVQGVAGNFLLGPATLSGVLAAACSERLCLAKTDSKILSATGETDAPMGPAIFAMDGDQAVVFFPGSQLFARWHDNTLDPLDWATDYWKDDGEILSIRSHGGDTEIAVRRQGTVWIVRPDDSVIDWIADTSGPVLLLKEGVLFASGDQLVLRHRDASEVRFELSGAETITAMGPHYAAIDVGHAGGAMYALRTESGREQLFLLPGNAP